MSDTRPDTLRATGPNDVLDLTRFDTPTGRPAGTRDDSDAHLLRLCLDLQLDALLLTLGASASARSKGGDDRPEPAVPWRRWVDEDVELAHEIAGDALAGQATLPPILGSDLDREVPATTIDNLTARYQSMLALLEDLTRRNCGQAPSGEQDRAWGAHLDSAREQCRRRLAELESYRLATTPPRGLSLPTEHRYLPGELLG